MPRNIVLKESVKKKARKCQSQWLFLKKLGFFCNPDCKVCLLGKEKSLDNMDSGHWTVPRRINTLWFLSIHVNFWTSLILFYWDWDSIFDVEDSICKLTKIMHKRQLGTPYVLPVPFISRIQSEYTRVQSNRSYWANDIN